MDMLLIYALVPYPTMHHFVTEMLTHFCYKIVHCMIYLCNSLWDLWDQFIREANIPLIYFFVYPPSFTVMINWHIIDHTFYFENSSWCPEHHIIWFSTTETLFSFEISNTFYDMFYFGWCDGPKVASVILASGWSYLPISQGKLALSKKTDTEI